MHEGWGEAGWGGLRWIKPVWDTGNSLYPVVRNTFLWYGCITPAEGIFDKLIPSPHSILQDEGREKKKKTIGLAKVPEDEAMDLSFSFIYAPFFV